MFSRTALLAVVAVLFKFGGSEPDQSTQSVTQKCLSADSGVGGSAIEKIINANPSKKIYEVYDTNKVYRYQIGLCASVGEDYAAVVQYNNTNSMQKYILGRMDQVHVISRHDYVELEYFGGQKYNNHCNGTSRTARIMFVCDPCGGVGSPVVVEEMVTSAKDSSNAHCFYLFDWPTKYACAPDHGLVVVCSGKSGAGAIVVAVLLGVFVLYIILGIIYKRLFLGAKGSEQFPHLDQWRMLGNLVADGCDCLCRRRKPNKVSYSAGLHNKHLEDMDESDTEDDGDLLPLS